MIAPTPPCLVPPRSLRSHTPSVKRSTECMGPSAVGPRTAAIASLALLAVVGTAILATAVPRLERNADPATASAPTRSTTAVSRQVGPPVPRTETPTATPSTGDVAALLADPPAPMAPVELDAYHGDGYVSWPGRDRAESVSGCPSVNTSPLTDQALWLTLSFGGHSAANPVPAGAPWLIAAVPASTRLSSPLPLFGHLRGHLGDPAYAHCPDADRVFTVEEIVATYAEKKPTGRPTEDLAAWRQYHDALGRFSLAYPHEWDLAVLAADRLQLQAPASLAGPVTVSVVRGRHSPTAAPGSSAAQTVPDAFHQRPPMPFATPNVPPLVGDVRYCAGRIIDGCIEVVFAHDGSEYVLRHQYGVGFLARQESVWTFETMAHAFQIHRRATVTPTPTPSAQLGAAAYWSADRAARRALDMIPHGPWSVTDTRLVSEAEALELDLCDTRRADPDYMWYTWPRGVRIIELSGVFDGRDAVFYTYLNAETGDHICTAEQGTRP